MKRIYALLTACLMLVALAVWAQIQPIGIGNAPNDGTGDTLRTAFGKVNNNFSYLTNWSQLATNAFEWRYQAGDSDLTNWSQLATNAFEWRYQAGDATLTNLAGLNSASEGQVIKWTSGAWTVGNDEGEAHYGPFTNLTVFDQICVTNISTASDVFTVSTNGLVAAQSLAVGATGTNVIGDSGSSINGVGMTNGWLWATNIIVTNLIATNIVRAYGGQPTYAVEIGHSGYPYVKGNTALYMQIGISSYYLLSQNFLRGRSTCRFEWSTNEVHQTPDLSIYRAGEGTLGVSNSVMVWSNVAIKASGDGVIDRTPVSGAAQFFAATNSGSGDMAEMYVQDEAGNETLISPHATDAPPELYDRAAGEVTDYIVREANPFVGTLHWVNIRRMARLTELNTMAILYLAGQTNAANSNALARLKSMTPAARNVIATESYAQYNARTGAKLEVLDWNAVQEKNQAAYDAERARLAAERESALATNAVLTAEGRTNELMVVPDVPPTRDVRKLAPTWLRAKVTDR